MYPAFFFCCAYWMAFLTLYWRPALNDGQMSMEVVICGWAGRKNREEIRKLPIERATVKYTHTDSSLCILTHQCTTWGEDLLRAHLWIISVCSVTHDDSSPLRSYRISRKEHISFGYFCSYTVPLNHRRLYRLLTRRLRCADRMFCLCTSEIKKDDLLDFLQRD